MYNVILYFFLIITMIIIIICFHLICPQTHSDNDEQWNDSVAFKIR